MKGVIIIFNKTKTSLRKLFHMEQLNKQKLQNNSVFLHTSRQNNQYEFNVLPFEYKLYENLRHAVPIIDAAICKIVRLCGGYKVISSDESIQEDLNSFLDDVPVGISGKSLNTFIDTFLDSLLIYGNAVGEILLDKETMSVCGLFNGNVNDIEIQAGNSPNDKIFLIKQENSKIILPNPELILFSSINNRSGMTYGTSILSGLPALSSILLRIYECIGQNYERAGNVRYAVTYNPGSNPENNAFANDRAKKIAEEWSNGMSLAKNGEIRDFVAVGDIDIKVIGSDNQLFDTNIPVRQILEQIVSKLSIPPFLLGLNWSSTERMSAQQADILTSELEYYRRRLTPIIKRIAEVYLRTSGCDANVIVEWDNINLQDEVALAEARYKNAQAELIENQLQNQIS